MGLSLEPIRSPSYSRTGARPACWAAWNRASCTWLCLAILLPRIPQDMGWSPRLPVLAQHLRTGHSATARIMRSSRQHLAANTNFCFARWRLRAWQGRAVSQYHTLPSQALEPCLVPGAGCPVQVGRPCLAVHHQGQLPLSVMSVLTLIPDDLGLLKCEDQVNMV